MASQHPAKLAPGALGPAFWAVPAALRWPQNRKLLALLGPGSRISCSRCGVLRRPASCAEGFTSTGTFGHLHGLPCRPRSSGSCPKTRSSGVGSSIQARVDPDTCAGRATSSWLASPVLRPPITIKVPTEKHNRATQTRLIPHLQTPAADKLPGIPITSSRTCILGTESRRNTRSLRAGGLG